MPVAVGVSYIRAELIKQTEREVTQRERRRSGVHGIGIVDMNLVSPHELSQSLCLDSRPDTISA